MLYNLSKELIVCLYVCVFVGIWIGASFGIASNIVRESLPLDHLNSTAYSYQAACSLFEGGNVEVLTI